MNLKVDRFYTGHEIFDEIVTINYGSSILVLDESYMEAKNLLNAILKKPIEFVSYDVETSRGQIVSVSELSPSDASVTINRLRDESKGSVIIHNYLPDFLIKYGSEAILRLIGVWREQTLNNKTVEFYLLPKGTFSDLEKKLISIVNGVIEVNVKRSEKEFDLSFIVKRICKPEWHLREFRYKHDGLKVLIEWEGEFTDKLPRITLDEIKNRVESYKKELPSLRVKVGTGVPVSLSNRDYWLLSQIKGKSLYFLQTLFYDRFDEILESIAKWHIMGNIQVVKCDKNIEQEDKFEKDISWKTKLALKLPLKLALYLLRSPEFRTVPVDVFVADKKAIYEFLKIFFGDRTELNLESLDSLLYMEEKFHEITGRLKAIKDMKYLENENIRLNIKYLPKIIKMVLHVGFKLDCDINKVSATTFQIKVDKCFFCEGIKSVKPICKAIVGGLTGACSLTFKRKINCKEIKCKALGNNCCEFELTVKN
ncbi:MAG: 4-vinyl reductase [Candidatus Methylarchaceae archaeon HK02M2]|nr:4-vinyl reductase [Candidatus Methylarchaceae archaeon HK02M2]